MSTKGKWTGGILNFYDPAQSYEAVGALAPVVLYDDFLGPGSTAIPAAGSAESGCGWVKKIVGAAPPTVAQVADQGGGVVSCALTADNQKQNAGLYWGDECGLDLTKGLIIEYRIKLAVLPTDAAEIVWGVVGNWADGLDAITYSAFFTADGSGAIVCEADDNTTDSSTASGVTVTNADWKVYRLDFTDVADVKFYIDGVEIATTIPYAATGANAILQPYVGCYKATGAGVGTVYVDYIKAWQKRS